MKKLICTILALAALLCLFAACGQTPSPSETTGSTPSETKNPEETTAPTETTGAEDTTDPEETTEAPEPAETIDDMALMDILDKVYSACGKSVDNFYNTEVEAENLSRYFGTDFDFAEAVASEYMIGGGYSFCLVRVDSDRTEEIADLIETHADPGKWICMFAEEVTVAVNGNVVMLCMASKETCQEIEAAFKNLK